jgi:hypothetical protein
VKSLIETLDPEELTAAREVMRAMTPEMRARLEGQCFARMKGKLIYTNENNRCALMQAFDTDEVVGEIAMEKHLPDVESWKTYKVAFLNDRGWLRTRQRVRELLALADDDTDSRCRICGEPNDDGEGWDSMCGSCADRAES